MGLAVKDEWLRSLRGPQKPMMEEKGAPPLQSIAAPTRKMQEVLEYPEQKVSPRA